MSKTQNGISPELDELSSELLGEALDALANRGTINVLLVAEAADGALTSVEFLEDSPEECLGAARNEVRRLAQAEKAIRYALVYEAAIMDDSGIYNDAVLLEFGEKGYQSYSAYCLVSNKGCGEDFQWSDPSPAGEIESLF